MNPNNLWQWSSTDITRAITILESLSRSIQTRYADDHEALSILGEISKALSTGGTLDTAFHYIYDPECNPSYEHTLSTVLLSIKYSLEKFLCVTSGWELESKTTDSRTRESEVRRRQAASTSRRLLGSDDLVYETLALNRTIMLDLHRLSDIISLAGTTAFVGPSGIASPISPVQAISLALVMIFLAPLFFYSSIFGYGFAGDGLAGGAFLASPILFIQAVFVAFIASLWAPFIGLFRRPCYLILLSMLGFISLSCFLGAYFTIYRSYGYSMGDSFTLAGYVIAIGALVCGFACGLHFPHCKCWGRGEGAEHVDTEGNEADDAASSTLAMGAVHTAEANGDAEHLLPPV